MNIKVILEFPIILSFFKMTLKLATINENFNYKLISNISK